MTTDPILHGIAIGTAGSYQDRGNIFTKALTGDAHDFFDGPGADGNCVGLDLGSACSPTAVGFSPRQGWSGFARRMIGGKIQAANKPDFSDAVDLFVITRAPTVAETHPLPGGSFRFIRYLSPAGSYGNISCLAFFGVLVARAVNQLPAPPTPNPPVITNTIFVSPTGNDANAGTQAAPLLNIPAKFPSHTAIYLERGGTFALPVGLNLHGVTDFLGTSFGNPALPPPTVVVGKSASFWGGSPACARISLDWSVTSEFATAATDAGYPYHLGTATFGNVHGTDINLNLTMGVLLQGPVIDGVSNSHIELYGSDVIGFKSQRVMILDVRDTTLRGDYNNSVFESPFRITGKGAVRCDIRITAAQQLDAAHDRPLAKSAIEIRAIDQCAGTLSAKDGEISFDTDLTGLETQTNCDFDITLEGSHLSVRPGASNLRFTGRIHNLAGSECVSESCGPRSNISYDLAATGAVAMLKCYVDSDSKLAGTWTPTVPGLPAVKAGSGADVTKIDQTGVIVVGPK